MDETMNFPDTWEEFVEEFGFSDSKEVYTNGTKLIPVFRVEQWLEHNEDLKGRIDGVEVDKDGVKG